MISLPSPIARSRKGRADYLEALHRLARRQGLQIFIVAAADRRRRRVAVMHQHAVAQQHGFALADIAPLRPEGTDGHHPPIRDEPIGIGMIAGIGEDGDAGLMPAAHMSGIVDPAGAMAADVRAALVSAIVLERSAGRDRHGFGDANAEESVARRAQGEIPGGGREMGLDVDHIGISTGADIEDPGLARHQPPVIGGPFDGPPPFDALGDAESSRPPYLARGGGLQDAAGGAALEGLVEIEIIGVFLAPPIGRRHPAMQMIRSDPEGIVMGMVGRAFRGHGKSGRGIEREEIGPVAPLRQAEDGFAAMAQRAPLRLRPGPLGQGDGIFGERKLLRHGPPRASSGFNSFDIWLS